ncbi:MAG TPA: hypothetical protein VF659_08275, partial [Pyrinomonadaceae bacterium]
MDTFRTDLTFAGDEEEQLGPGAGIEKAAAPAATPENPLPRAVLRPNSHWLLDGEWQFALDPDDRGLRERWYLGHRYERTAQWPGSVEAHMAEAKEQQQSSPGWQDKVVAWYEREVPLPERRGAGPCRMLQITFGACGYETRVWLNGRVLRTIEGEKVHLGEYTSFSYELPEDALRLVNRITVRIADTMDGEIPRGKQQSHVYKRGGIWYQTYTGAVRSVWIEPVERNRLRSRLTVLSSYRDRFVSFDLTTRTHDPGLYDLLLTVTRARDPRPLLHKSFRLPLGGGDKRQRITVELPETHLWSPSEPNLYRLVAQLSGPDGGVSQIEAFFGLRTVEARGDTVYLNGEAVYLDGVLYQPGTATYEEMQR